MEGRFRNADTLIIHTQMTLTHGVALMYSYNAQDAMQLNVPVSITRFSYLHWKDPVWYPDGNYMDVRYGGQSLPSIQLLTGSYVVDGGPDTVSKPDQVAFAGGLVQDSTINMIRVSFGDGASMLVKVENHAYLTARYDAGDVVRVEALDVNGNVRQSYMPSER